MNSRLPRTRNMPSRSGRIGGAWAANAHGSADGARTDRAAVRRNWRRFMWAKAGQSKKLPMSDECMGCPVGVPGVSPALHAPHALDQVVERLARLARVDRQRH